MSQSDIFLKKRCLATGRISCHRRKFLATWRNFLPQIELSQEEISCHRKKFPVPGAWGKFYVTVSRFHTDKHLFLEEISCTCRNFIRWYFLYQKKIPSKKEICFTDRILLCRKKFALQKKAFNRRNFVAKNFTFNCKSLKAIQPLLK